MNRLSIIIPSRTFSNVWKCVEAIHDRNPGNRLIIVDDGLADSGYRPEGTDYEQGACLDGITFVKGIKPFIFARNINIGIRAAGDDDVILLNDDALLETPDGFSQIQTAGREHPEYGVIGAVTNVTGQPLQHPQNIGLREVPHFAFVCVYIPRATIDLVGLLDERYCLDYGVEDLDYCKSVASAGLKVGVFDGCYVDHGSLTSAYRGHPRTPKDFSLNYGLFKQKWAMI